MVWFLWSNASGDEDASPSPFALLRTDYLPLFVPESFRRREAGGLAGGNPGHRQRRDHGRDQDDRDQRDRDVEAVAARRRVAGDQVARQNQAENRARQT